MKRQYLKSQFVILIASLIAYLMFGLGACAQNHPSVDGAIMYPTKENISNTVKSKNHTALVAAVQTDDLVNALQSKVLLTVLESANSIFNNVPAATLPTLLLPERKNILTSVFKYHVLSRKWNTNDIKKAIHNEDSLAVLSIEGDAKLTASRNGASDVVFEVGNGYIANISIYDLDQNNGVMHVIDSVVLP